MRLDGNRRTEFRDDAFFGLGTNACGDAGSLDRRASRRLDRLLRGYWRLMRPVAFGTVWGNYVRVEHVHIHEGGQAVIGNVRARDSDRDVLSST